jgi:N6-adenosine-specific RNA methylase IME4
MKIFDLESHKFADIFPMVEGEQAEQLKLDIKENGLIQPIVLFEGKILDGRNRYKASKELGLTPKFETYTGEKPLEFVISGNLKRRHLTESQRAVIAQDIMPMLEEEARKRQGTRNDLVEKVPQSKKEVMENKSAVKAGKIFQVNEKYIREVKKLREAGNEKVIEEIRAGTKTISEVKKEERIEKIEKQRADIKSNTETTKPTGKYNVIVIDPPWDYGNDENYNPDSFRGTCPYPVMKFEEIKDIKLPAEKDCVLWLWTTNKFMLQMQELLDAWEFEFKTILTWDKEHIAIGKWLRSQTEHCILAVKGKPFYNNTKWGTLIREKRTEHSTKPEIFYKMVDEICAGRKLDYFARKKRNGWDVYGDEIKEVKQK